MVLVRVPRVPARMVLHVVPKRLMRKKVRVQKAVKKKMVIRKKHMKKRR